MRLFHLLLGVTVYLTSVTSGQQPYYNVDNNNTVVAGGNGSPECLGSFVSGAVCPLDLDNVIDIDGYSADADEAGCQYSCFRDRQCSHFTLFTMSMAQPGDKTMMSLKKCVLFKSCPSLAPCRSCFTGPAVPPIMECVMMEEGVDDSDGSSDATDDSAGEEEEDYSDYGDSEVPSLTASGEIVATTILTTTTTTTTTTSSSLSSTTTTSSSTTTTREATNGQQPRPRAPKQLDADEDEDEDEFEVVGIDEGLLGGQEDPVELPEEGEDRQEDVTEEDEVVQNDEEEEEEEEEEEAFPDEYFDEDAETVPPTGTGGGSGRRPPFFHCVMGGYGPRGPISTIGHLLPTTRTPPRRRPRILLPSLPSDFPLGEEGMLAARMGPDLLACSPGARDNTIVESLFGPFGPVATTAATTTSLRLRGGRCFSYSYSSPVSGWRPLGGAMNAFRGGGAMVRMGRFIVAIGGRGFPAPLNSLEVLNTRNPRRWRTLNRLSLPRPTFDQCVVAINKTALLMTGGFGQESQAIVLDLKGKKWAPAQPMKQPRRKHSCLKARVNGRDGVIVAGGASAAVPALASVEFYDLRGDRWLSLGRMRQGRRFPGLTVVAGNLLASGGEADDALGRPVILDSLETLREKRWRPVRQRMPQPRSRFASIRIPRTFF